MLHEVRLDFVVLREGVCVDNHTARRFSSAEGFILYACAYEDNRLYCVTIRRGDSKTSIVDAESVKAFCFV